MIKFDRDVHNVLRTLEKEGFETYAMGDCVRNTVAGIPTLDWDLATKATQQEILNLFPSGRTINQGGPAVRIDFETDGEEGATVDIKTIDGKLSDLLHDNKFTIMAMADNPERGFFDPYNGREDMKKKLIRTVEPAAQAFKDSPISMMEAVYLAADMNYDLHKEVFDGILSNWRALLDYDREAVKDWFERIIVTDNSGKGLSIMAESGLMAVIFGEAVSKKMSANEMKSFTILCENIDKTKPVRLRRLGLLYTVLGKKKAAEAIERLPFDEKTKMHLEDALNEMITIQFLGDLKSFKRYLFEHGMERYNYVHNLAKAHRIVYDQPATKIEARNAYMKIIKDFNEPVFTDELKIDASDIMQAGIADTPERAEELLDMVVACVHSDPRNNERNYLLKMAKKYSKSKLSAKTRYVKWIR